MWKYYEPEDMFKDIPMYNAIIIISVDWTLL